MTVRNGRTTNAGSPLLPTPYHYIHIYMLLYDDSFVCIKHEIFFFLFFFYVDPMSRTDTYDTARVEKKN